MKPLIDSDEKWLDVVGYEGLYSVSDKGRVYSQPRTEFVNSRKGGYYRYRAGKILTPYDSTGRYPQIILCKDGVHKTGLVHRLVLTAFVPEFSELCQVNHKNGVKTDNRLDNLEWVTPSQNQKHSVEVLGNHRGTNQGGNKLAEEQVMSIIEELDKGETEQSLAKRFSVKRGTISSIKCGKNWSWLTGIKKK